MIDHTDDYCRPAARALRDAAAVDTGHVPLVDELGDRLAYDPAARTLVHVDSGDRLAYMAGDTFRHAISGDPYELA